MANSWVLNSSVDALPLTRCGPWTRSIGITWKLVGNTASQAPPDLLNQSLHVSRIPGWFTWA